MTSPTGARRPRVTFVSQWYAPEPGAGIPQGIATALRDRGFGVDVLTGFPNYPEGKIFDGYRLRPYQREVIDGLDVHRSPLYFSHDTNSFRRAANYLSFAAASTAIALAKVPGADVCLVYSSPILAALPAISLHRTRGTPVVLYIQDMWPQSVTASGMLDPSVAKRVERYLHRVCDWIYRQCAQIAITSPGMRDLLISRGVPEHRIHFVPNWVDHEVFRPVASDPDVKTELGITRPFSIMYAGNMGEAQGLEAVLEAATALRSRDDIQFVFVGSGAAVTRLREQATRERLANVTFVGPQPLERMSEILAAADVQLISLKDDPLFRNTLPSKLQGILAAGRPVIGAIGGDAARIIEDSGAGIVSHPGSFEELARNVIRLRDTPNEQLRAMGERGRRRFLDHYHMDVAVSRLSEVLVLATQSNARSPSRKRGWRG